MVDLVRGAVIGLQSGGIFLLGESFVGDGGMSRTGGGDGTSGGNMACDGGVSLLMVTSLIVSLGFVSACVGSSPMFCASYLLKEVAICPMVFSRSPMVFSNFFKEA